MAQRPRGGRTNSHPRVQPESLFPPELEANKMFTMELLSAAKRGEVNYERIRKATIWKAYVRDAAHQDKHAVAQWMNNMDNLLRFAAPYSATLSVILILSSAKLKPDAGFSQMDRSAVSFVPSPRVVRVNFLWLCALSFAILAATGAMLAKSWCQEYSRQPPGGSPFEQAQRRQRRYTGLQQWKFQEIVELLPVLLYFSIILFIIGLCDYFVDYHVGLAITTTAIFASGLAFAFFTIAASVRDENCPFRLPLLHAVQRLSLNQSATGGDFAMFGSRETSQVPQRFGIIERVLHYMGQVVRLTVLLTLNRTLSFSIQLLTSAGISQQSNQVSHVLMWVENAQSHAKRIGMDFVEDQIDPNDQTVVDSICWIFQHSLEPAAISAVLLLIPDVIRSPQHHLELFRAGAGDELIQRCYELSQLQTPSRREYEVIRSTQLIGLTHLFHFLTRPLAVWVPIGTLSRHDIVSIQGDLENTAEPEAKALAVAFDELTRTLVVEWESSLDRALETSMSRPSTIGWLSVVGAALRPLNRSNLRRLNKILDLYWKNHDATDFGVNYAYVSAVTAFLGYSHTTKHSALRYPSYRACLFYCVENFAYLWRDVEDPDEIRAVGFIAAILGNHFGDSVPSDTQLTRSFDHLSHTMSAHWNNLIPYRLAAVCQAARASDVKYFDIPNLSSLISYTFRFCSKHFGNPELWNAASRTNLESILSLLVDLDFSATSRDVVMETLPRYRLLLAQVMAALKKHELTPNPIRQSIKKSLGCLLWSADLRDSTTLLVNLTIAGFPDTMHHLLSEGELSVGHNSPGFLSSLVPPSQLSGTSQEPPLPTGISGIGSVPVSGHAVVLDRSDQFEHQRHTPDPKAPIDKRPPSKQPHAATPDRFTEDLDSGTQSRGTKSLTLENFAVQLNADHPLSSPQVAQHTIVEEQPTPGMPRVRNKATHACRRCRLKKKRCEKSDKATACQNCVKAGWESQCIFPNPEEDGRTRQNRAALLKQQLRAADEKAQSPKYQFGSHPFQDVHLVAADQ